MSMRINLTPDEERAVARPFADDDIGIVIGV